MTATPEHVCTLTENHGGLARCSCGLWWQMSPPSFVGFYLVNGALRQRLRDCQRAVEWQQCESPAEWVKQQAERRLREREADRRKIFEAALRDLDPATRYARFVRAASAKLGVPGAPCAYCGDRSATLDHVLPTSRWPALTLRLRNVVPACKRCNGQKGARTPEEWRAARERRGLPWPRPIGEPAWYQRQQALRLERMAAGG